jgi:hypothetical protein
MAELRLADRLNDRSKSRIGRQGFSGRRGGSDQPEAKQGGNLTHTNLLPFVD